MKPAAAHYREVQRASANDVITRHSDLVRRIAHHLAARLPADPRQARARLAAAMANSKAAAVGASAFHAPLSPDSPRILSAT